jgi:hypothetical protein
MNARMSLGRQPPPKPRPACRNRPPMRSSWPSASASSTTSAPVASHTSAIALMNEILVARNEFAATLTSSAVARSVTTTGTPWRSRRVDRAASPRRRPTARRRRAGRAAACPDGEALAQELGVPGELDGGRRPGRPADPVGQPRRGADRDGRLADDERRAVEVRGEGVDGGVHVRRSAALLPASAGCRRRRSAREPKPAALDAAPQQVRAVPARRRGGRRRPSRLTFSGSTSTPMHLVPSSAMHAAWVAPR